MSPEDHEAERFTEELMVLIDTVVRSNVITVNDVIFILIGTARSLALLATNGDRPRAFQVIFNAMTQNAEEQ